MLPNLERPVNELKGVKRRDLVYLPASENASVTMEVDGAEEQQTFVRNVTRLQRRHFRSAARSKRDATLLPCTTLSLYCVINCVTFDLLCFHH